MELKVLIAYLVSQIPVKGKKAMQKLTYFCSENGVPIYANFRLHIFGPYSNEVAEELGEAVAIEIVKKETDGYTYYKGDGAEEILMDRGYAIEPYKDKIKKVLDDFGGLTPLELELYATVHFIATALQGAYKDVPKERIIRETARAKEGKFSRNQIEGAYGFLLEKGWLKN